MMLLVTLILLFNIVFSKNCCRIDSACPSGSYCLCQPGIDTCIYDLSREDATFSLTKTQNSYFYWNPQQKQYDTIKAYFCKNNNDSNAVLNISFKMQDINGTGYSNNFSQKAQFQLFECFVYVFQNIKFCQTTNKSICKLLIGTKIIQQEQIQLSISITATKTTSSNYLLPILITAGFFLFLFLIIIVIYVIRKKIQSISPLTKINHTNMLDKYAPRISLKQLIENKIVQNVSQNCGICLGDVTPDQMTRQIPCRHILHAECLDDWCKVKLLCPMCRQSLQQQNLMRPLNHVHDSTIQLMNNNVVQIYDNPNNVNNQEERSLSIYCP